MRIGVNALYLIPGGVGGTEIYLRNLLAAMARADGEDEWFIFVNAETRGLAPDSPRFEDVRTGVRARVRPARIAWEQTRLPAAARRLRLDVLFNPGFTAPLVAPCPQVTVFHDLQHKRHPEYFRWFDLPFWNLLLAGSARVSRRVIAVSAATAADLRRYYGVDATVVHHGVSPALREIARRRAPERFLMCVSTLHPHKNIDGLVRAFAPFRARHPEFRLVLAGMRGFYAQQVDAAVRECGLSDSVEITGWLPDESIVDLYRRAWAFVYPSRFEGFGMPVLEAMAAGVPVGCSDIPVLREVAGDAALLFDPERMEPALESIAFDDVLRAKLAPAGIERSRSFTWEKAAAETLAVLRAAAG